MKNNFFVRPPIFIDTTDTQNDDDDVIDTVLNIIEEINRFFICD